MERISISLREDVWELEKREVKYIYSYLFRYSIQYKFNLLNDGQSILLGNDLLEFRKVFENALRDLIVDCYEKPEIKVRQKHPTRFEKFDFEGTKYVVNYIHSVLGRLMYTLNLRLEMIDEAIKIRERLLVNTLGFEEYDIKH